MKFQATVSGANRQASRLYRSSVKLDTGVTEAQTETLVLARRLLAAAAPVGSGRLRDSIRVVITKHEGIIKADPKDPDTGYSYIRITRFGHQSKIIKPKKVRALEFEPVSTTIFRASVRGFRPKRDWADKPKPEIKAFAKGKMKALGGAWVRDVGSG